MREITILRKQNLLPIIQTWYLRSITRRIHGKSRGDCSNAASTLKRKSRTAGNTPQTPASAHARTNVEEALESSRNMTTLFREILALQGSRDRQINTEI